MDNKPASEPELMEPWGELLLPSATKLRSSRDTKCLRSILALSWSVRSSRRLGSLRVAGVVGRRGVMPAVEGLRDGSPGSRGRGATRPGPLGVPIGVALDEGRGILGGGGVPAYWARSIRGLGEPEIGTVRLGDPLTESEGRSLGLVMSTGFEGTFFEGEVMIE